jgi:hypothetical protein
MVWSSSRWCPAHPIVKSMGAPGFPIVKACALYLRRFPRTRTSPRKKGRYAGAGIQALLMPARAVVLAPTLSALDAALITA